MFGFLAMTQLGWLWLAPGSFKSVWSKNPLVVHIIREHHSVEKKAKLLTISYYYPDLSYFARIAIGPEQPNKGKLGGSVHDYYQIAADLLPDVDSAHFLLGFCEYYMGNSDEAIAQYEKSAGLDPYFFWSYYNLWVIYFKKGDFLKSTFVLNKALSLKSEITLGILHQNPFYQQIWRYIDDPAPILESNLSECQKDAALLLADCFVKAGWGPQALQIINSVEPGNSWHQGLWEYLHKKANKRQAITDDLDRLIQEQISVRLF